MQKIRDVMTTPAITLAAERSATEAAEAMRDEAIGDVLVVDGDLFCGLVTDRDLVVRVLAADRDPRTTRLGEICSRELRTLGPDDDVAEAVELMRSHAVRRVPVLEEGRAVGIVSIGDLALERDPSSALADISAAPANI
jgi:CBS domain-containing protein